MGAVGWSRGAVLRSAEVARGLCSRPAKGVTRPERRDGHWSDGAAAAAEGEMEGARSGGEEWVSNVCGRGVQKRSTRAGKEGEEGARAWVVPSLASSPRMHSMSAEGYSPAIPFAERCISRPEHQSTLPLLQPEALSHSPSPWDDSSSIQRARCSLYLRLRLRLPALCRTSSDRNLHGKHARQLARPRSNRPSH
jgi:hypothetical protein